MPCLHDLCIQIKSKQYIVNSESVFKLNFFMIMLALSMFFFLKNACIVYLSTYTFPWICHSSLPPSTRPHGNAPPLTEQRWASAGRCWSKAEGAAIPNKNGSGRGGDARCCCHCRRWNQISRGEMSWGTLTLSRERRQAAATVSRPSPCCSRLAADARRREHTSRLTAGEWRGVGKMWEEWICWLRTCFLGNMIWTWIGP